MIDRYWFPMSHEIYNLQSVHRHNKIASKNFWQPLKHGRKWWKKLAMEMMLWSVWRKKWKRPVHDLRNWLTKIQRSLVWNSKWKWSKNTMLISKWRAGKTIRTNRKRNQKNFSNQSDEHHAVNHIIMAYAVHSSRFDDNNNNDNINFSIGFSKPSFLNIFITQSFSFLFDFMNWLIDLINFKCFKTRNTHKKQCNHCVQNFKA